MIAVPFALGQTHAPQNSATTPNTSGSRLAFDVVSIRPSAAYVSDSLNHASAPGELIVTGITVKDLIVEAYGLRPFQVLGGPSWMDSERYDVHAKVVDDSADDRVDKLVRDNAASSRKAAEIMMARGPRLQSLLVDRFGLKVHASSKEMSTYALAVGKNGSKLHSHPPTPYIVRVGLIQGQGVPINVLISNLSFDLGKVLVDKTGLTGYYDIDLEWTPDDAMADDSSAPSLSTALQEQLGLKLESQKSQVQVLVVDHLERPSPN
jgi:uncharacterized protein (TIGR03435 family)